MLEDVEDLKTGAYKVLQVENCISKLTHVKLFPSFAIQICCCFNE